MALPHPTTGEDPAQTKLSVSMQKVRVEYGEEPNRVVALDDLDLDVRRGDFVVILGPSGSGKTTLLNVASGLAPLIPLPRAHQVRYHDLLARCWSGRDLVVPRPAVSS